MKVLNFLQSTLAEHERRARVERYRSAAPVSWSDGHDKDIPYDDATLDGEASGPYSHIGALWFRRALREKNHLWHADDDLCILKNLLRPSPADIFRMRVDGFTEAGMSGAIIMFGTLRVGAGISGDVSGPHFKRYHDRVVFKFTFEQPAIEGGMDKNRAELETYKFLSTQSIPFVMQYYDSGLCDTADVISSITDEENRTKFCSCLFKALAANVTAHGSPPPTETPIPGPLQQYDDPRRALELIKKYMSDLDTSKGFRPFNGNAYRMLFVMTERAQGRTLKDFILDPICTDRELMSIIAQLMWTLYRFEKVGVMHYDLHAENVKIDDLKTVGSWRLFFGHGTRDFVSSRTRYMAKVYDWDFSAVIPQSDSSASFAECNTETTIKNSSLDGVHRCKLLNACNRFVVGRDAVQILWWIQLCLVMRLQISSEPHSNFAGVIKVLVAFIPSSMPWQGDGLAHFGHPCSKRPPPAPCVPIENLTPPIEILKACRETLGTTARSDDIICASVACNDHAVDDERKFEHMFTSPYDKEILTELNRLVEKS